MRPLLVSIFTFAASIKLAVIVILLLAAYLAAATFYESRFGVTPTLSRVYGHWSFLAIMVVLAINVLAAAVIRYPWKRHQTGFVITHAGLLTLLFGGLISYRYSVDGFLPLAIGQTDNAVSLRDERLSLTLTVDGKQRHFAIPVDYYEHAGYPSLLAWVGSGFASPVVGQFPADRPLVYQLDKDIRLEVIDWLVAAELKRDFLPTTLTGPAVQITLAGAPLSVGAAAAPIAPQTLWLDDTAMRGSIQPLFDGLIEASLARTGYNGEVDDFLAPSPTDTAAITLRLGSKTETLLVVPEAINKPVNLAGGWVATLTSISPGPRPTARLRLQHTNPDGTDTIEYELDPLHPHVPRRIEPPADPAAVPTSRVVLGPSVTYHHPEFQNGIPEAAPIRGLLQLLQGADGRLHARLLGRSGVVFSGTVKPGDSGPAWMKLNLTIDQHVPAARLQETWVKADVAPANLDKAVRAARVALTMGTERRELTIARGAQPQTPLFGSGTTASLAYGFLGYPMPFSITLLKAEQTRDPGSAAMADFVSELLITEKDKPARRHTLTLNQPLSLHGLTFYHSSMDTMPTAEGDTAVTMSTLSVRKDPGTIIKYLGGLLISLGVFTMFYMKAYHATGKPRVTTASPAIGQLACMLLFVCLAAGTTLSAKANTPPVNAASIAAVPVLYQDRVQPLDSLARQVVLTITGKRAAPGGLSPVEWVLDVTAKPGEHDARPLIYVPHLGVRQWLGLPADQQRISPNQLRSHGEFLARTDALRLQQRTAQEKNQIAALNQQDLAALVVRDRYDLFEELAVGSLLQFIRTEDGKLVPVDAATDPIWRQVQSEYVTGVIDKLAGATLLNNFSADVRLLNPRLEREVTYNWLHPFRLAAYAYSLTLLVQLIAAAMGGKSSGAWRVAHVFLAVAVLLHIAAFALRCSITGFAPVTNLYETVVWVGLVAVLVAAVIARAYHSTTLLIVGTALAAILGFVADLLPADLGHSIKALTPVLRSNMWLTVHVLPIVSSYAAFAVAMMLGNVLLVQHVMLARGRLSVADTIRTNTLLAYRAVQVGVFLVITGTILGGLWADLSWGRFWGWDPKEVWALIICLTYLAVLHGRFAGWVKPLAFAAACVLAWLTVIMSWYGVNFVLGIGLHSYGFGTGGQIPVAIYCLIQLIFVVITVMLSVTGKGASTGTPADTANAS